MEKSVQPDNKYTNDEDEYIQKTFSDKSLTFRQIEKQFEERFNRRLAYNILFNRNEFLLEETNQYTNNVAISQRACANDPEAEEILLNDEILSNQETIQRPNKKLKLDTDAYETLKRDYEALKKENENLKLENKRIISNAAERLKVLSDRKSKLNLDLKADNLKLNNELNLLRSKLADTDNQLKELKASANETSANRFRITINENENRLIHLTDELDKLKNENLILKIEKDKALSYAYHYVKKLKDFENALIKERISQTSQKPQKELDTSKTSLLTTDNSSCSSSSSQSSTTSSISSSSISPFSSGNFYININEFLGRPIIKISESNGSKSVLGNTEIETNANNRTIELNSEESQFLKKYMVKIENQLKNYLETSIKSYYNQQQQD